MKKLTVLTCALALFAVGCRGCDDDPERRYPDFVPTPGALQFSACPAKDSAGGDVPDVFPDSKKLIISNEGPVSGTLGFSFSGSGASQFSIEGTPAGEIPRLDSTEVTVKFSPNSSGSVVADLIIDDGDDDTENKTVSLVGEGINLPARAQIETAVQCGKELAPTEFCPNPGFKTCTTGSPLYDCELNFPNAQVGETTTLEIKIKNLGCPSLKISALEIEDDLVTPGSFAITTPAILPSEVSPLVLTAADNTQEQTIVVTFTALDDGSGFNDQLRTGLLRITSNDASNPTSSTISLVATATKPAVSTRPTSCNFTQQADLCGNPPPGPRTDPTTTAKFQIRNDGPDPITIDSVTFRSSGTSTRADGRFTIAVDPSGQTLPGLDDSVTLEVAQVDQPLLVSDQLDIETTAGRVSVSVLSGIKPCLTTDPSDVLDFGNQEAELGTRALTIRNAAGCGLLKLASLEIDNPQFYTLVDPQPAAGAEIAGGAETTATVQYRRPPTGGQQLATLKIASNDPDHGAGKIVILQSNAPLDLIPTAVLTGCLPATALSDPQCADGLTNSMLVTNNGDTFPAAREITLSGYTSTDDNGVNEYRFSMLPTGANPPFQPGATLQNANMWQTDPVTRLVLTGPTVTGTWRIQLQVKDTRNQQSVGSVLQIIVTQ